jgi:hypothetical protein
MFDSASVTVNGVGATRQMVVTAHYADNTIADMTPSVTNTVYITWIMHTISVPSAGSARLMLAVVE